MPAQERRPVSCGEVVSLIGCIGGDARMEKEVCGEVCLSLVERSTATIARLGNGNSFSRRLNSKASTSAHTTRDPDLLSNADLNLGELVNSPAFSPFLHIASHDQLQASRGTWISSIHE